ncbi:hypothetical protein NL676_005827 [Syzygium grande]|nr:hypothetical protein NL676_005827 [Syzygium grande]
MACAVVAALRLKLQPSGICSPNSPGHEAPPPYSCFAIAPSLFFLPEVLPNAGFTLASSIAGVFRIAFATFALRGRVNHCHGNTLTDYRRPPSYRLTATLCSSLSHIPAVARPAEWLVPPAQRLGRAAA